jgi:hypothetical protein
MFSGPRRLTFVLHQSPGEEAVARWVVFDERVIAMIVVVADGAGDDQRPGLGGGPVDPVDQASQDREPGGSQLTCSTGGDVADRQPLAREVHNGVDVLEDLRRRRYLGRPPLMGVLELGQPALGTISVS